MLVVCVFSFIVNVGGVGVMTKADVEGKLLKEDDFKYLVDFSKDIAKYDLLGKPEDYKKVLVDKNQCIKE